MLERFNYMCSAAFRHREKRFVEFTNPNSVVTKHRMNYRTLSFLLSKTCTRAPAVVIVFRFLVIDVTRLHRDGSRESLVWRRSEKNLSIPHLNTSLRHTYSTLASTLIVDLPSLYSESPTIWRKSPTNSQKLTHN